MIRILGKKMMRNRNAELIVETYPHPVPGTFQLYNVHVVQYMYNNWN